MEVSEYIKKSAASFRNVYPFPERKEKHLAVFFDLSILEKSDIPVDVIQKVTEASLDERRGFTRTNDLFIGGGIVGRDGLQYCVDLESETYTIYNKQTGKRLFSVIRVIAYRYAAYKANTYGIYDGLPVKSASHQWRTDLCNHMYDLEYTESEKDEVCLMKAI